MEIMVKPRPGNRSLSVCLLYRQEPTLNRFAKYIKALRASLFRDWWKQNVPERRQFSICELLSTLPRADLNVSKNLRILTLAEPRYGVDLIPKCKPWKCKKLNQIDPILGRRRLTRFSIKNIKCFCLTWL